MALTKEQANKIEVKRDTEVGDLYSYEGAHHQIWAEHLAKWAYRRLETWPLAIDVCNDVLDLFCLNENADVQRLCKKAKEAIGED